MVNKEVVNKVFFVFEVHSVGFLFSFCLLQVVNASRPDPLWSLVESFHFYGFCY